MAHNAAYCLHDNVSNTVKKLINGNIQCEPVKKALALNGSLVSEARLNAAAAFLNALAKKHGAKLEMTGTDFYEPCTLADEDYEPVRTKAFYQEMLTVQQTIISQNHNPEIKPFLDVLIINYMDFEDKAEMLNNLIKN